jgi:hypothetical protein
MVVSTVMTVLLHFVIRVVIAGSFSKNVNDIFLSKPGL